MNDNPSDTPEDKSSNDQASEENNAMESEPHRRIQDGIKSKDPTGKMNLDRRYENSERRCIKDSDHKGPPRRFTIDRRLVTRDRRKPD